MRARTLAPIVVALACAACGGSTSISPQPEGSGGAGPGPSGGAGGGYTGNGGGGGSTYGGGGAGGTSSDAAEACGALADAYCTRVAACAPVFVTATFGDLDACKTRMALSCEPIVGAPGAGSTASVLSACAGALGSVACGDLLTNGTADACKPHGGSIANGNACGDDWQCQSGRCKKDPSSGCGTCGPRASSGGTCASNADCQFGLVCAAGTKTCVALAPIGSSCDGGHPCAIGASCVGASSGSSGTCRATAEAGAACDPQAKNAPGCDLLQGLYCDPTSKTCRTIAFAGAGGTCGYANGAFTTCRDGAVCKVGSGDTGACIAPAADGASCDASNGPGCLAGAACIGGICRLEDPASCR